MEERTGRGNIPFQEVVKQQQLQKQEDIRKDVMKVIKEKSYLIRDTVDKKKDVV